MDMDGVVHDLVSHDAAIADANLGRLEKRGATSRRLQTCSAAEGV